VSAAGQRTLQVVGSLVIAAAIVAVVIAVVMGQLGTTSVAELDAVDERREQRIEREEERLEQREEAREERRGG